MTATHAVRHEVIHCRQWPLNSVNTSPSHGDAADPSVSSATSSWPRVDFPAPAAPRTQLVSITSSALICTHRFRVYGGPVISVAVDSIPALPSFTSAVGGIVKNTLSRRAFVTALGMLSVPLIALAQDKKDDKEREEKKKEAEKKAEEKKEDAKDKAEDAVDDRDKVVDPPGTDHAQDRRQDRRRDGK
jgi:hypothetical protein